MKIGIITERPSAALTLGRSLGQASHDVLWVASSAAEAVHRCSAEAPDLVLMALPLIGIDGVDVTRTIMSASPCPILIVTADVHTSAAVVFDAMGQGALDVVDMPTLDCADPTGVEAPLLAKIDTIAKLIGQTRRPHADNGRAGHTAPRNHRERLVVIGASAGGPAAVATLLRELPSDLAGGIVVVQHVDEEFVSGMAHWLSEQSGRRVSVAREGEHPATDRVLVAGATGHLTLKTSGRLGYTAEPRHYAYRPSVDVFFQSVSRQWRGDVIGVLLTGMGKDGALGLKALRDRGHHTIAQDEASSAVYGMPKAAAGLNAAVDILPLDQIAARVRAVVACANTSVDSVASGPSRLRGELL